MTNKVENKNSIKILGVIIAGALVLTAAVFLFNKKTAEPKINLDSFAQCLTDKGATEYGTESCYFCQEQKKLFGNSFRLINYVDCQKEPNKCVENKIENTPTWIFSDGNRLVGLQTLEKLSEQSSCPLPK